MGDRQERLATSRLMRLVRAEEKRRLRKLGESEKISPSARMRVEAVLRMLDAGSRRSQRPVAREGQAWAWEQLSRLGATPPLVAAGLEHKVSLLGLAGRRLGHWPRGKKDYERLLAAWRECTGERVSGWRSLSMRFARVRSRARDEPVLAYLVRVLTDGARSASE